MTDASEVVLATFANLSAIAGYLARSGAQRVVLVPAGNDLPLCFATDTQAVVPRVVPQPDQIWFVVQNVSGTITVAH